jgi:PAS domain S-box-containing protein
MWLKQQKPEFLAAILRQHPCPMIFTDDKGHIVYANREFSEWSEYSLPELERMNMSAIHMPTDVLQDTFEDTIKKLSELDSTSTFRTLMRPKNNRPCYGTMYVRLYGSDSTAIYWCVWEPQKDQTAEAFALAIERTREYTAAMEQLRTEIQNVTQQNQIEAYVVQTLRLGSKYPKVVYLIVALLLSSLGINNILEIFQRAAQIMNYGQAEPKASESPVPSALYSDPLQHPQYAGQGILDRPKYSFTTKSGNQLNWDGTHARLQRTDTGFGESRGRSGHGSGRL